MVPRIIFYRLRDSIQATSNTDFHPGGCSTVRLVLVPLRDTSTVESLVSTCRGIYPTQPIEDFGSPWHPDGRLAR